MDFIKTITLKDQSFFDEIFRAVKPISSEMTFPYLYAWRHDYNIFYSVIEDHLCMISRSTSLNPYAFCPIPVDGVRNDAKFKKALEKVEDYFNQEGIQLVFRRVEELRLEELKLVFGERLEIELLESTSDYVYNASDLIYLSGKKFSKKRNHIKQFLRKYGNFEYVPIDNSNLDECRRIFNEWCEKNENICDDPDYCEKLACFEILDNWDKWDDMTMKGALIKVGDNFEAFTIGELLNPDTTVIHFEKGNSAFHGIYSLINREFCANEWKDVNYFNREEDMGNEGLRKSKLSYNPAFMVNKFLVKVIH